MLFHGKSKRNSLSVRPNVPQNAGSANTTLSDDAHPHFTAPFSPKRLAFRFYFGGGTTFVEAGAFVASAPGARLGGVLVATVRGIADVPESMPGVLDGGGVAGVVAGGRAAGDVW